MMNGYEIYREIIKLIPYLDDYLIEHDIKKQYILGLEYKAKNLYWNEHNIIDYFTSNIRVFPDKIFMYSFNWPTVNDFVYNYGLKPVSWRNHHDFFRYNHNKIKQSFLFKNFKHIKIM